MASQFSSSPFPGYSHCYSLGDPFVKRPFRAELDLSREEVLALFDGDVVRSAPIHGQWAMDGSKPQDIIWTTYALPMLMNERVVSILREGHFTGWDVVPVELSDKTGKPLPTYYFLCVHGRCGPIDDRRSLKIDKIFPGGVFPVWMGLYFDETTWDGSDVFLAAGTGFVFVVEAVKHAFDKAKVRNVEFTPLDQVERRLLNRR